MSTESYQDERGIGQIAEDIRFTADLAVQIFQQSPDAIIIVHGETGRIRLVNDQAEFLTGYHRSELRNQTVDMLVPQERRPRHLEHRTGYMVDPKVRQMGANLNLSIQTKSGREVPVDIMLAPVSTMHGLFVIATLRRREPRNGPSGKPGSP